jgi:hypothetical protein
VARIKYTLVSEGTSDQALLPILDWIFRAQRSDIAVNSEWADPGLFPNKPRGLAEKIRYSVAFFPCDVLFVHRDSDNESPSARRAEIEKAVLESKVDTTPYICVIPVQETEAWFLFDATAIRNYVGNPDGKEDLNLPKRSRIEQTSRPKERLLRAFEAARKSKGRRQKSYENAESLYTFALSLEDFAPLRALSAFGQLEADIQEYLVAREK